MTPATPHKTSRPAARTLAAAVPLGALTLVVLALGLLTLGAGGCALLGGGQETAEPKEPPSFADFLAIDPASIQEPWLKAWYDICVLVPGVHMASFDGENTYILAARGEKPSGGYGVDLWNVAETGGTYTLTFRTTDPAPGQVVDTVLTYPATLIRAAHPAEAIAGVEFEGPESLPWPVSSPANTAIIPTSPLPGDEVSTPALHVEGYARVFEAEFAYALEDGHNVLAQGGIMADAGGPEWGHFSLDIPFAQPTSPGLILRLYDESAMDGSIVFEIDLPLRWTGP